MIDRTTPWYWLNENSQAFLARGYLAEGQTAQERIQVVADTAERILGQPGFADRLVQYVANGWVSFSSPVWSNFGTSKGLPISCFGSAMGDNMASILHTQAEVGMMSKYGGGTSAFFGTLRERGADISANGHSSGPVHFMQLFESILDVISQGAVRRGTFTAYLPIDHPDILEFLDIGTEGNPIQKMTYGVTVGDDWLQAVVDGDEDKRVVWARVLQRRRELGYPYILFRDTANRETVDAYKDTGQTIVASNACSEIMLPSTDDSSFVCCLSSVNLLHYDEWKDSDLIETMIALLDAVMSEFITKLEAMRDSSAPEQRRAFLFMERTYRFANEHRALGLGVLGWHSLLQSRMINFSTAEAAELNEEIFKHISGKAKVASENLAQEYGEPAMLRGYGRRNTTLMAVAPTTSSGFILGQVSQGIEPVWSNCYVKDVAKLKVTIKNPWLEDLLETKGENTKEVWNSIRDADGSVQHLEFLDEHEQAVFRTFAELDQSAIIDQAAARQQYIDQGQSLNITISPDMPIKEINQLYLRAWQQGVKSLYYQHSRNAAQQLGRDKIYRSRE
ncbi:ribonucleoside-diphosphate reductase subunit alpha [bacterium]|nr:ribonucleoside-diphosphate reductase subunit alpha [bacterium]